MNSYEEKKQARTGDSNIISSDDPEAVSKLEAKLAQLTAEQEEMKNCNAYYRKHQTMKGYPNLSDYDAAQIDAKVKRSYSWNSSRTRRISSKTITLIYGASKGESRS